jgi:hypothetical protein
MAVGGGGEHRPVAECNRLINMLEKWGIVVRFPNRERNLSSRQASRAHPAQYSVKDNAAEPWRETLPSIYVWSCAFRACAGQLLSPYVFSKRYTYSYIFRGHIHLISDSISGKTFYGEGQQVLKVTFCKYEIKCCNTFEQMKCDGEQSV